MRRTTTVRLIVTAGVGVGCGAAVSGTATVALSAAESEPAPLQPTTAIAPQRRTNNITLARTDATFVTGCLLNIAIAPYPLPPPL
jgi:hypothetical protein